MSGYIKKDIYNKGTFLKKEDPFITPVEYLEDLTAIRISPAQLVANAAVGKYAPKHQILIDPGTGLIYGQSDGIGGYVSLLSGELQPAVAGTVNGDSQHLFTFTADSGQRLVSLILNINAASDVQASEQIAAGFYTTTMIDPSGEMILRSNAAAIERVGVTALATSTYAAGDTIAITETNATNVLASMSFIVAPTAEAKALVISSVPTYTAGLLTSVIVEIKFAEEA